MGPEGPTEDPQGRRCGAFTCVPPTSPRPAAENGAQIIVPAMPIANPTGAVIHAGGQTPFGRLATVADPQGAGFQLLEI